MNASFWKIIEQLQPYFEQLESCPAYTWNNLQGIPQKGVYAFYEDCKAIYVGRSNRMQQRIREHGAKSSRHESATFAFKLLRDEIDEPEGHRSNYTRKQLQEMYPIEYEQQRRRIRNMTIRAVEIKDQPTQAVFEIYAVLALDTKRYNTFHTT